MSTPNSNDNGPALLLSICPNNPGMTFSGTTMCPICRVEHELTPVQTNDTPILEAKPAREFWINDFATGPDDSISQLVVVDSTPNIFNATGENKIHVIEYSAYRSMEAKYNHAYDTFVSQNKTIEELTDKCAGLEAERDALDALTNLQHQNCERLKEENARLTSEVELFKRARDKREKEAGEQAVTAFAWMQERDKLRAELAECRAYVQRLETALADSTKDVSKITIELSTAREEIERCVVCPACSSSFSRAAGVEKYNEQLAKAKELLGECVSLLEKIGSAGVRRFTEYDELLNKLKTFGGG